MKALALSFVAAITPLGSACSPFTGCDGLSRSQALQLALEQKRGMLGRSVRAERENFASDVAEIVENDGGYVAKVSFRGKDGRTLVAPIEADCYVGWTLRDP